MKNEDFAHAVATIRAMESKLLDMNEVERMVLAKNAEEAYKVLNDLDYSTHIGDIQNVASFQEVINAGLTDVKRVITRITPHIWVFDVLWFRYDFHNIKTLLKAKLSGKKFEEVKNFMMPFGAIEVEKLKALIFDNQKVEFKLKEEHESAIKAAIKKAEEIFNKTEDPQMIDLYLDKKFCEITLNIALASKHPFIVGLVQKYIDLKNVEIFIRLKVREEDEKILEEALISGGTLEKSRFRDAFKKDLTDFSESMKHTDYAHVIKAGIDGFKNEKSFATLEKHSYDHLTDYIQPAKRTPFGPEPIIGYFWAKKNNALIIRTIMVGKLNGFEPEEIKAKLRTLY